jgi:hypothetical protein
MLLLELVSIQVANNQKEVNKPLPLRLPVLPLHRLQQSIIKRKKMHHSPRYRSEVVSFRKLSMLSSLRCRRLLKPLQMLLKQIRRAMPDISNSPEARQVIRLRVSQPQL